MIELPLGGTYTLVQDTVYGLPSKSCRISVYTSGGTINTSVNNSNFQAITLDANKEFVTAAAFIKSTGAASTVSVKET